MKSNIVSSTWRLVYIPLPERDTIHVESRQTLSQRGQGGGGLCLSIGKLGLSVT